jgi:hypothetical protein
VSIVEDWTTESVDMAVGDLGGVVDGVGSSFWEKSSLIGEDLEFCLAGDSVDRGSGILSVSRCLC